MVRILVAGSCSKFDIFCFTQFFQLQYLMLLNFILLRTWIKNYYDYDQTRKLCKFLPQYSMITMTRTSKAVILYKIDFSITDCSHQTFKIKCNNHDDIPALSNSQQFARKCLNNLNRHTFSSQISSNRYVVDQ